jgi:glutamate formiminotransferase / 5-formyltetrahydrofolate cyclo-ligase
MLGSRGGVACRGRWSGLRFGVAVRGRARVHTGVVLECVANISEGVDSAHLDALARAAAPDLLDVHRDPDHHRSVMSLLGEEAPRRVARIAVDRLDLSRHRGVHPRLGVVDVVPFIDLDSPHRVSPLAIAARDAFAAWAAESLGVPSFLYGPLPDGSERSLPELRRRAFVDLAPDVGPRDPHPSAGAICVGARPVLVAYNVWLPPDISLDDLRQIAASVRRVGIRTLGLMVGDRPQISMNLIEPWNVTPADAFDAVVDSCRPRGVSPEGAELVGLVPREVLQRVDRSRWAELDLADDRTIEARLARLAR